MKTLLAVLTVAVLGGLAYLRFVATGWCDDGPTGFHCNCWSRDARDCCFCTFHDGPHAALL